MKPWICSICNVFRAINLRALVSHYNRVHANESNFRVVCNVDECPASFTKLPPKLPTKFTSFYKHVRRSHLHAYEGAILDNSSELNEENTSQILDDTLDSDPESSSSEELEMTVDYDEVCF